MIALLGPLLLFGLYVACVASLSSAPGGAGLWRRAATIAIPTATAVGVVRGLRRLL